MDTLIRDARILKEPLLLSTRPRKSEADPIPAAAEPAPVEPTPPAPAYAPAFVASEETAAPTVQSGGQSEIQADMQSDYARAHYAAAAVESVRDEERERQRELQWQQELEAAKEEARQKGFAEGYQSGTEAGEREYAGRVEELQALLHAATEALEQGISGEEDLLVEIVFAAVSKILGETMTTPEGVTAAVRQVVQHVKAREHLVIRVCARDFALLNEGQIIHGSGLDEDRVQILMDDRVQLGGCLLETAGGSLDGRLEIQLNQLREILLKAKAQSRGEGPIA